MIEVKVNPGICGLNTIITTESNDGQNAAISIKTECPNLKPLENELKEADGFTECFGKMCDTKTYKLANKYCKHTACPVPCAIIKAIEAACGFALPKDACISVKKL